MHMRADRKESLRKWVNLLVPAASLALAGLMGPIAFTLRSTVKDLVRQELASYETVAAADARLKAHKDYLSEILKRWANDFAATGGAAAARNQTNDLKLTQELGDRLSAIESKLETLTKALGNERPRPNRVDCP